MVLVNFMRATGELHCIENDCGYTTRCIRDMDLHKSRDHGHELTLVSIFCSPRRQWFCHRNFLQDHLDSIHNGKRPYLCECGFVSAKAFADQRHRATCGQGHRCGNRKTKRVRRHPVAKQFTRAFQHVNEQIELNITGESVVMKYAFSEEFLAQG